MAVSLCMTKDIPATSAASSPRHHHHIPLHATICPFGLTSFLDKSSSNWDALPWTPCRMAPSHGKSQLMVTSWVTLSPKNTPAAPDLTILLFLPQGTYHTQKLPCSLLCVLCVSFHRDISCMGVGTWYSVRCQHKSPRDI